MKRWGFLWLVDKNGFMPLESVELISYYDEDIGNLYEYRTDDDYDKPIRQLIKIEINYPSLH